MVLPDKIEIRIVDRSGQSNPLPNIILGLKVFKNNNAWYNYSVFKTDSDGHIILTRQQIIDNTELKHDRYIESGTPTRFEIYVWDGLMTVGLINTTKRLLDLYNDESFIRTDLSRHGVAEENIPAAVEATQKKGREDLALFEQIKDAINANVQIYTEKIQDVWLDVSPKQYEFIIE
jgi:hypothetical protein